MTDMDTNPETQAPQARSGQKARRPRREAPPSSGGAVYGLGMIGALAYFVGTAESGRGYALAVGKAIVWPALLVYRAFRVLGD